MNYKDKHHHKHQVLTSSRTRISSESLIDSDFSTPTDKDLATQEGVDTKISGGPANAFRCKQAS